MQYSTALQANIAVHSPDLQAGAAAEQQPHNPIVMICNQMTKASSRCLTPALGSQHDTTVGTGQRDEHPAAGLQQGAFLKIPPCQPPDVHPCCRLT